ncbi:MAG: LysM peptidoglycan-binding domain-containing protein [Verrucomicrobia bacterium]|nr:LysM peptidoglycan-binding domain-containing protein [Verrucomicrobiota bacterium]
MRRTFVILTATLLAWQSLPTFAQAATFNEEVARSIAPAQRRQLETLSALSLPSLAEIRETFSEDALIADFDELEALGSLAIGVRAVDEVGRSPIHHFLLNRLEALSAYGVEVVGTVRGNVAAPVLWHKAASPANRGPEMTLTVGGVRYNTAPIWPNGAIPSITPANGLSGRLVDVRRADWDDLRGLDLQGAIALMDFAGGRRIERLFSLGAIGVIVAEDAFVNHTTGHLLFQNTPLPFPRFFVDAAAASGMRASLRRAQANGSQVEVFLQGGHIFENRPFESIFAYLPPAEPLQVEVTPSLLLDLIANDFLLRADDLMLANNLSTPVVQAGQTLIIPGGRGSYTVGRDDLIQRLARLYGNSTSDIRRVNNLGNDDPPVGTRLSFPNAEGPLVVVVPIDSTSIVPDFPHGAQVRANIAVALRMLAHSATSQYSQRRRGLLMVFQDGDTLAGIGSRTLAEYTFLQNNRFSTGTIRDSDDQLSFYRESAQWFLNGTPPATANYARRLADDWLYTRVEAVRVEIAERVSPGGEP